MIDGVSEGRRSVTIGEQPIEIRRYLNSLRRALPFIALFVAMVTAVAVVASSFAEKRYRATATIVEGSTLLSADSGSVESTVRQLETIQRLLKTDKVIDLALKSLTGLSSSTVSGAVSSSVDPGANIINVSAEHRDARTAAAIANAVSTALLKTHADSEAQGVASARSKLLVQLARLRSSGAPSEEIRAVRDRISELVIAQASIGNDLRLAQPAVVPSSPFTPRPVRDGVIAFFASAFLAVLVAIGRDVLRPRISDPRELAQLLDLPVLARVPLLTGRRFKRGKAAEIVAEEAYQTLQASIRYAHQDGRKIVVVTSALKNEGKTTTSVGLARALARAGHKTLLICADLRLPTLHDRLGIDRAPGFSDLLQRASRSEDLALDIRRLTRDMGGFGAGSLGVVPSGSPVANPAELLFGGPFDSVLSALGRLDYEYIVIDGPPLLGIADGHALAQRADSVLLAVRPDRLKLEQVLEMSEKLSWLQANTLGLVVSGRYSSEHAYGYVYARAGGRSAGESELNGARSRDAISEAPLSQSSGLRPPR